VHAGVSDNEIAGHVSFLNLSTYFAPGPMS
jgi:hypothetical protein